MATHTSSAISDISLPTVDSNSNAILNSSSDHHHSHHHHHHPKTEQEAEAQASQQEKEELTEEFTEKRAYIKYLTDNNSFFSPPVVLTLTVLLNFFQYADRGAISPAVKYIAVDQSIAGNTTLTEAQTGALYSIFMVGFFVFAPLAVGLGGYISSKTVICLGVLGWCISVVLAGVAQGYGMLMFARGMAGIGEAAYAGYSVTIVDNIAPPEKRTTYIAWYYSMIPTGTAAGIAINGIIVEHQIFGVEGWRCWFFIELIPMIFLMVFLFMLPKEYNVRPEDRGEEIEKALYSSSGNNNSASQQRQQEDENVTTTNDDDETQPLATTSSSGTNLHHHHHIHHYKNTDDELMKEAETQSHVPFFHAVKLLLCNFNFLLLAFGYGAYTFTLGSISVFAISMLTQSDMGVSTIDASMLLGASTSLLGMIGAVLGGVLVDRWGGSKGYHGVYKCCIFIGICVAIAVPSGYIALLMEDFVPFACIFVFTVWWLFLLTAPLNTALLTVVPESLRPYSITLSILILHASGDVPSPPLTGVIADAFDGGCSDFGSSEDLCISHNVTRGACKFIPPPGPKENARCVNTVELQIALRIVWTVMILAVPLWFAVAWRVNKHKSVTGDPMVDDDDDTESSINEDESVSVRGEEQRLLSDS